MFKLISTVSQPARYVGGETGSVIKHRPRLTFALAFPEIYELAMSHLGMKIIYDLIAPREDIACERIFAPWVDLMDKLYSGQEKLWSLESGRSLDAFDVVGFSLPYELLYSNLLHMLHLGGIPVRREQRQPYHPVILGGGPCMVNPEPIADFLDLALVGEAEQVLNPLLDLLIQSKEEKWPRRQLYETASNLTGVYAPALFEPLYENNQFVGMNQKRKVRRAIVKPDISIAQCGSAARKWYCRPP